MRQNKKKRETESMALTMLKVTRILLDAAICIYILMILAVMPFYNQEGYAHIGTDKSTFFQKVSTGAARITIPLLIFYLVIKLWIFWRQKGTVSQLWTALKMKVSLTDLCAGAYGISVLMSYAFSRYKQDALWGAAGWHMGLYTQLMLVGTYFFVSKCWKPKKWIFLTILPVSAVVFVLGYLNRFDIDPLQMKSYGSMFISTVGNINWYCGYQVSVFFAGVALLWQGESLKIWQRILLMLYTLIGFASLITQGSSSGIAAMAAVLMIMFCMSASDSVRMCRFWQVMSLLGSACLLTYVIQEAAGLRINYSDISIDFFISRKVALTVTVVSFVVLAVTGVSLRKKSYSESVKRVIIGVCVGIIVTVPSLYAVLLVMNSLHTGSIGALSENQWFIFSNTWGSNRGATWKAGILCFMEQDFLHKLVGVGPDAMMAYIYREGSARLLNIVTETFSTARLTNAHNEWLTVLVDTGIVGCVCFVGMVTSATVRFLRKEGGNPFSCACGFCLLGYTVNNMFSFQQALNAATIFVVLGIGEAFKRS